MILEKSLLDTLISCKKRVDKVEPREQKSQWNHKQQTIKISWWGYFFELYTRKNMDLLFNFSAWLLWKWPEWTVCLCRYNWNHWGHKNPDGQQVLGYHKHIYRIEDKEAWLNDDAYAEQTDQYDSLEKAIYQLCIDYNIDYGDKLPYLPQKWTLFDFEGGNEWNNASWISQ